MRAAFLNPNLDAKDVLASLKAGALLRGRVRSHSACGNRLGGAWVGIELPAVGEREVLIEDQTHLDPGQRVVIQCVPNPAKPGHYHFHLVSAAPPRPHPQRPRHG